MVDVEVVAEDDFFDEVLDGFALYVFALVDHETKELAFDDGDLLLGIEYELMVLFIVCLCLFDYLGYLIKPLINLLYYLLFDGLLIPLLIVLHALLLIYFFRKRYILQKNRVVILSNIQTIIHPTIISLYTFTKQVEIHHRSQHKHTTQVVQHRQELLVLHRLQIDQRNREGTDISATSTEHVRTVVPIDARVDGIQVQHEKTQHQMVDYYLHKFKVHRHPRRHQEDVLALLRSSWIGVRSHRVLLVEDVVIAARALQQIDVPFLVGSLQVLEREPSGVHVKKCVLLFGGEGVHGFEGGIVELVVVGEFAMEIFGLS